MYFIYTDESCCNILMIDVAEVVVARFLSQLRYDGFPNAVAKRNS